MITVMPYECRLCGKRVEHLEQESWIDKISESLCDECFPNVTLQKGRLKR